MLMFTLNLERKMFVVMGLYNANASPNAKSNDNHGTEKLTLTDLMTPYR